jgi:2,4-dienoyl-CoA reductase-like NADH-dependent reductase (Old Yellow Enzyme family)
MHLLRRIERYLKSSGTPATRFGREAVRDPRLVHDLRRGREPGSAMRDRVSAYLDSRELQVRS